MRLRRPEVRLRRNLRLRRQRVRLRRKVRNVEGKKERSKYVVKMSKTSVVKMSITRNICPRYAVEITFQSNGPFWRKKRPGLPKLKIHGLH